MFRNPLDSGHLSLNRKADETVPRQFLPYILELLNSARNSAQSHDKCSPVERWLPVFGEKLGMMMKRQSNRTRTPVGGQIHHVHIILQPLRDLTKAIYRCLCLRLS